MPTANALTFPLVALLVKLSDAATTSMMWVAVASCILVALIRLGSLPLLFSNLSILVVNLGSRILSNSSFSFARSCRVRIDGKKQPTHINTAFNALTRSAVGRGKSISQQGRSHL
jgi:hypothetical protein